MSIDHILASNDLGPTITIGEILVEIMATETGNGFSPPLTFTGPYPSGAPAIFIDQCAKLTNNAGIIATVGKDAFGEINIRRLQQDGVDISAISVDTHLPTGSAFVRYRDDGERDFVFNIVASAAGKIVKNQNTDTLIAKAGHIHIMGTLLSIPGAWEMAEYAIDVIKSRGGTLSFDPNIRKELITDDVFTQRLAYLLGKTDLLLPSGEEILTITESSNLTDAVKKTFAAGVIEIVLKQGKEGATSYHRNGKTVSGQAFQIKEIDPTGAGDCFGATYVSCRRLGMSLNESLTLANAAGARNVQFTGPMEGTSTLKELHKFIQNTPRKI
ncbi:sugar kinase [Commensalibacter papalotli (ex Botero et al. 2024)]|uniref:Ribokinase family (RbsK) (PDB:2QCV) n=1 Tax=Commensalibacter papalotli (ex Botero et al. 2024) TaxID=2972766 RepID=A0ABN8W7I8_9PROT|nr:sugar kinase [Commensalibacter papalotli (ex Botero et al. 2024)]CAI3933474.1 Sugar or nucleoside kinase [Commensalibacter papalotli (ex Botero et al. 2024)]CAI3949518.1 Sugar or nucleoside kinase [Commensalibacter papalotli (ex Botero et al. 2024)]